MNDDICQYIELDGRKFKKMPFFGIYELFEDGTKKRLEGEEIKEILKSLEERGE